IAVEQEPENSSHESGVDLLKHWIGVLKSHKVLVGNGDAIDVSQAQSIELPVAHALSQESVADRTLLIGPAGGFYSACAEDIYPNCWSSIFAVEVAQKAL